MLQNRHFRFNFLPVITSSASPVDVMMPLGLLPIFVDELPGDITRDDSTVDAFMPLIDMDSADGITLLDRVRIARAEMRRFKSSRSRDFSGETFFIKS